MAELTDLARSLIDQPLVQRPSLEALRARNRHRRGRRLGGLSAFLVVIALVGAFGLTRLGNTPDEVSNPSSMHLAAYFQAGVSVPDTTLAAVGLPSSVITPPTKVTPVAATAASNNTVSYVGAEYCPFCALQRWALLVALSKFGTFENLTDQVLSSSSDVYPNLASWSFVGARYTSPYFSFDPTELTSSTPDKNGYQPLQKMSPAQEVAYDRFDPQHGIPFVDLGNHYITLGASASPSVLEGLSLGQIGSSLTDPASPVAQAIDGSANYLIASMCSMISGTAPAICSTPTTTQALGALDSGVSPTANDSSTRAPVQPPTDAPTSVWQQWSDKMHTYLESTAPTVGTTTHGCTVLGIDVSSTIYKRTTLGIPPGVKVWSISGTGSCNAKPSTGGKTK